MIECQEGVTPPPQGSVAAPLRAVVAVPVRNEEERIGACLLSLEQQPEIRSGAAGILLLLNNCTDRTADAIARRPSVGRVRVLDRSFHAASAGWARREAMREAAAWLAEAGGGGEGVLLTTDADSRVPAGWLDANLRALEAGADAVFGRIALDPDEAARLPATLRDRGGLEAAYENALAELSALVDPIPHDPWPNHRTASGATFAVTRAAYHAVGELPEAALGEDRLFEGRLLAHDRRVRHDPDIVVWTSGRLDGRAPGGAADTMRLRCENPDSPCDQAHEPLARALFRFRWRRRLRLLHGADRLRTSTHWAGRLSLGPRDALLVATSATAGAAIEVAESTSPRLLYRPLRPRELRWNIALARLALRFERARRRSAGIVAEAVRLLRRARRKAAARSVALEPR